MNSLKPAEHRVNRCGPVANNRCIQSLERAREDHIIRVHDESIRGTCQPEAGVARIRQAGVELFVDNSNGVARVFLPRNRLFEESSVEASLTITTSISPGIAAVLESSRLLRHC